MKVVFFFVGSNERREKQQQQQIKTTTDAMTELTKTDKCDIKTTLTET